MKISDAFPSKYISAADLNDQAVVVTIEKIRMEEIGDQEEKPVVYFSGRNKGLVLNKTNATTIAGIHGQDTDDWVGKSISLFPTQTEFQGRAVECIRVKIKVPATQEQTEEEKPDIPF